MYVIIGFLATPVGFHKHSRISNYLQSKEALFDRAAQRIFVVASARDAMCHIHTSIALM